MVCMAQLNQIMDKPEAVQLYQSIINDVDSDNFNPTFNLSMEELGSLFTKK